MDNQELINLDLEMKLINNRPIYIGIGYLHSPTINEISDMGLSTYNTFLTLICSSFEELKEYELLGNSKAKTVYEWIIEQCLFKTKYQIYILNALAMFLKEKISFIGSLFFVGELSGKKFITEDVFDGMQTILRKMCCVENLSEETSNPANDKVRELLEKKKKYNEKLRKAKQNNGEDRLTLSDLISVYCADGNGASVLNIGNYTMYQFNNQFNRMKMLQDYNVNVQALLHGADNKEELQSWMRKIKVED